METQARKLHRASSTTPWLILGFLPIPFCLIGALFLNNESLRGVLADSAPMLVFGGVVLAAALAASVLFSRRRADRNAAEFKAARLMKAEGAVKLCTTFNPRWGTGHYVTLDGARVDVVGVGVLEEGVRYRLFYAKSSLGEFILSFEKL
jgi:hypothetical protein